MTTDMTDATSHDSIKYLATDDTVVIDIARGLCGLFYLWQFAELAADNCALLSKLDYSPRDIEYVRRVLVGEPDDVTYEREMRDAGLTIVSAEEYDAATRIGAPSMLAAPYGHVPRQMRIRNLRRAFVELTAQGIAERDHACRSIGSQWSRGSAMRGTADA